MTTTTTTKNWYFFTIDDIIIVISIAIIIIIRSSRIDASPPVVNNSFLWKKKKKNWNWTIEIDRKKWFNDSWHYGSANYSTYRTYAEHVITRIQYLNAILNKKSPPQKLVNHYERIYRNQNSLKKKYKILSKVCISKLGYWILGW